MQKKHSRERKVSLATKQKMRTPNFEVWKWNHEEVSTVRAVRAVSCAPHTVRP